MNKLKSTYLGVLMLFFGFSIIAMTTIEREPNQQQNHTIISSQVTMEGTVVDETNGEELSDVEVRIDELSKTVSTNSNGLFIVEDLSEGETYTLEIDHEGYEKYEKTVEVITMGSSVIEVEIELTPIES